MHTTLAGTWRFSKKGSAKNRNTPICFAGELNSILECTLAIIYRRIKLFVCFNGFVFYVGVAVLNFIHVCLRRKPLFACATFLCACSGVGLAFFSTRHTWLYVPTATVWMWRHVSVGFFSTTTDKQRNTAEASAKPTQQTSINNFLDVLLKQSNAGRCLFVFVFNMNV